MSPKRLYTIKGIIALTMFLIGFSGTNLYGQENLTAFYFNALPQSARLNPAATFDYNGYFGGIIVPLFGQAPPPLNLGFSINSFSYSDIFYKPGGIYGDSLVWVFHDTIKGRQFADGLKPTIRLNFNTYIDLLHLGFRTDNLFWHFSIVEKIEAGISFPRDIIRLPLYGNANFPDPYINLSGLGARAIHYREVGLGVAMEINPDLVIGGKTKILFGMANLNMKKTDIHWYTDPATSNFRFTGDFDVNFSQPFVEITDLRWDRQGDSLVFESNDKEFNPIKYALNMKNLGLAVDLGVSYSPIDKLKLHASLTDLGFIHWKKDVTNIKAKGEFNFEGINLNDLLNDSIDIGTLLMDSLFNMFDPKLTHSSYNTTVPFNIYFGSNYFLTDYFNFGLMYRGRRWFGEMQSSLTISANYNRRGFGSVISYSLEKENYNNLGVGLTLKIGGVQIYFLTDNLIDALFPQYAREFSLRFGTNIVLGRQRKHASLLN